MGTSAVDLPDPLQAGKPETAQNADDLLAQLAGDEIDRLLAEADGDAKKPPRPTTAQEPEPESEPEPVAEARAGAETPVAADLGAGAGGAREGSTEALGDAVAVAATESGTAADTAAAPTMVESAPAPASVAQALGEELAEEEAAVDAASAGDASLPGVLDEVLATPGLEGEGEPSALLRPLYWLNKPFEDLSDDTRSFLGKVAILTLINAVAVLGYVLYLRK